MILNSEFLKLIQVVFFFSGLAMKIIIFVVAFLLQIEKGQFKEYSNKGKCSHLFNKRAVANNVYVGKFSIIE